MHKIHLDSDFDAEWVSFIEEALVGRAYVNADGGSDADVTIWVGGSAPKPNRCPRLEALIVPFAGVPIAVRQFLRENPAVAGYNLHFNAGATAEMAVGLLISAARNVALADRMMREGIWRGRHSEAKNLTLEGKSALIYGAGAVGQRVAQILAALGMTVNLWRRADSMQRVLTKALGACHVLVVTAPLTPETEGSIGRAELLALRQPRMVVNVGRGPIVNEADLYNVCQSGEVAAAGLDVWYRYPKEGSEPPEWPSEFPFWELDNVVLSPHRAGNADDTERRRSIALVELILLIVAGHSPTRIDPEIGY